MKRTRVHFFGIKLKNLGMEFFGGRNTNFYKLKNHQIDNKMYFKK